MSAVASMRPTAVVFDLGGVLVDWDPRYLYRQLFDDPDEMESFLAEVTTAEWNAHQDAGRPWAEAVELLVAEHPQRRELIEAFHRRWPEMLAGEIPGTVERACRSAGCGRPIDRAQQLVSGDVPVCPRAVRLPGMVRGNRDLGRRRSEQARPADLRPPHRAVRHRARGDTLHRRLVGERRRCDGTRVPRDPVHRRYGVAARTGATWAPSGSPKLGRLRERAAHSRARLFA